MLKLLRVLKKPNQLGEPAAEDRRGILWYVTSTRGQVKLLHALGVSYTIIFCFLVCWSSVTLGLPIVFEGSPRILYAAQILMVYICFCIESNYLLIRYRAKDSHLIQHNAGGIVPVNKFSKYQSHQHSTSDWSDSTGSGSGVNGKGPSDWSKCDHCEIEVPPRSRHCAICQTCVLKKDHHCFFTGCCIGFYNQRYFITFCVFGMIGGTWGMYNLGTYLAVNYAPILSIQIYNYFLPVCLMSLLLGYATLFDFFLVFLFYLHMISTLTSYYYFGWQMFIISRGQTSYECMKSRKIYAADFWSHMRTIFGPNWFVGFLIPVPFIVNEGDGTQWRVKSKAS